MARNDRKSPDTGMKRGGSRADARRSHSIRFADSEWKLIEKAAARQGIPAGESERARSPPPKSALANLRPC